MLLFAHHPLDIARIAIDLLSSRLSSVHTRFEEGDSSIMLLLRLRALAEVMHALSGAVKAGTRLPPWPVPPADCTMRLVPQALSITTPCHVVRSAS